MINDPVDVNIGPMFEGKPMPIMVTPRAGGACRLSGTTAVLTVSSGPNSLEFISAWVKKNEAWVSEKLLTVGVVYFRGFDVNTPKEFERVGPSLMSALTLEGGVLIRHRPL